MLVQVLPRVGSSEFVMPLLDYRQDKVASRAILLQNESIWAHGRAAVSDLWLVLPKDLNEKKKTADQTFHRNQADLYIGGLNYRIPLGIAPFH